MTPSRYIQSGSYDAATNMAVDEALLYAYKEKASQPVLRIYGWQKASFSFGCSQNPETLFHLDACEKEKIPLVRRPTGGGIIYHDDELTYSIILSQSDLPCASGVKETLKFITSFLIHAYQKIGVRACFAEVLYQQAKRPRGIADFCFSRKEQYDLTITGKKIGGNAQKRKKQLILQHGVIPFSFDKKRISRFLKNPRSLENLNITSLHEMTNSKISFAELSDILKNAFCEHFSTTLEKSELNEKEKMLAEQLKKEKYGNPNWNLHRQ